MIDRRQLLLCAGALACASQALAQTGPLAADQERLPLWPGTPPGGGGPSGAERVSGGGDVHNIAVPQMDVVSPVRPNGTAVLIAAGGGYFEIAQAHEAAPAAHFLADHGITAFILSYRLPGEDWGAGPKAPLQDAQRAIRLIRSQASARSLNPGRIGVLGFSAGGHLMGLAATRSAFRSYPPIDAVDELSARPDFAALLYPVVTLEPPFDHTFTRREMIGRAPGEALQEEWSVQTHVRHGCPPMFLANAEDDAVAYPANTRILEAACQQAGVPVEVHTFPTGGHGFGMGQPGTPTAAWPDLFFRWLRSRGMLDQA